MRNDDMSFLQLVSESCFCLWPVVEKVHRSVTKVKSNVPQCRNSGNGNCCVDLKNICTKEDPLQSDHSVLRALKLQLLLCTV